jgi:hypothetical protein
MIKLLKKLTQKNGMSFGNKNIFKRFSDIRFNFLFYHWVARIVIFIIMIALICCVQSLIWINVGP